MIPDLVTWVVEALAVAALAMTLGRSRSARWLADNPNERSLHESPIPKVGGIALVLVGFPVAAFRADADMLVLLGCALFLALLSVLDDVRSLPIEVRLPAHLAAALVAVLAIVPQAGIESAPAWVEGLLAVGAIAWMTNLYNFMDGSDGLSGGMAAIGFASLAVAAGSHSLPLAWCAAAIAAASAGFLAVNFPPARVFLGDAGSIPLGFLAAGLGLAGVVRGLWPAWFPVLVFSPFIADATVTIARRALRREKVWRAHREHAYQRLVLSGWPKRRLALAGFALMAAAGASAVAALRLEPMLQCGILAAWAVLYALLFLAIDRHAGRARGTPANGIGPEQQPNKAR